MQRNSLILALLLSLSLAGCATSGSFTAANLTNVELAEANYEIVATNVQGQSSAEYILGISFGAYQQQQTLALARVSGTGKLYGEALENLWNSFREQYGETEGRNLALVNVHYDTDAVNLILYTKPTVSIYADVVEFTD